MQLIELYLMHHWYKRHVPVDRIIHVFHHLTDEGITQSCPEYIINHYIQCKTSDTCTSWISCFTIGSCSIVNIAKMSTSPCFTFMSIQNCIFFLFQNPFCLQHDISCRAWDYTCMLTLFFFYTLAAFFVFFFLNHFVSAMSMHRCWTSHKLAREISVFLTFLSLVSMFAETVIQILLVPVDGGVRAGQTISCTILEPSWFEEGLVSQLMIVTLIHNILSFFSEKHSLKLSVFYKYTI